MIVAWVSYLGSEGPSPDFINTLIASGPTGILLVMLLTGMLITKLHANDLRANTELWRKAYEEEKSARETEARARESAEKVAERQLEQGHLTVDLLNRLTEAVNNLTDQGRSR